MRFGGCSLRDKTKTLSLGSLFQWRNKADSDNALVAMKVTYTRMASKEAEKEMAAAHKSPLVMSKHSPSTRDSQKHATTSNESQLQSSDDSHKENVASKRSAPIEDSEKAKRFNYFHLMWPNMSKSLSFTSYELKHICPYMDSKDKLIFVSIGLLR